MFKKNYDVYHTIMMWIIRLWCASYNYHLYHTIMMCIILLSCVHTIIFRFSFRLIWFVGDVLICWWRIDFPLKFSRVKFLINKKVVFLLLFSWNLMQQAKGWSKLYKRQALQTWLMLRSICRRCVNSEDTKPMWDCYTINLPTIWKEGPDNKFLLFRKNVRNTNPKL